MEPLDSLNLQESTAEQELSINAFIKNHLQSTAKWARFLSIIGFITLALIITGALLVGSIFSFLSSTNPAYSQLANMPRAALSAVTAVYLGFALLHFFPTLYLFQFATKTLNAIKTNNQQLLNVAFEKQKSLYKFIGVFTAIILGFYGLIILIFVISAAA